jgi:hypothetical protein
VLGADDGDEASVLLAQLIGEHHAVSGHGPEPAEMLPACETCGLLLEAMWSLDAERVAS